MALGKRIGWGTFTSARRPPDAAGGMTILIQNGDPGALPPGTYWLQSPATDTFYLILRVYVPDPQVSVTQTWAPPEIVRLP